MARKSRLCFQALRPGKLPPDQRMTSRESSGFIHEKANGVDLVGGYHDAGDNVKFGLPMASADELQNAVEAVKWGTDYFIKAHREPHMRYGEVGDGDTYHNCCQAFGVDPQNPGSDLAGETAAAMAASSMIFRTTYPGYANLLLEHAKQLFEFADKYRGQYDPSIKVARNYYGSFSGYGDELLWAAAWLFEATEDRFYLEYLATNGDALGGTGWSMNQFVKHPGVQDLAAKFLLQGRAGEHADALQTYRQNAEFFVCSCVGKGAANVPQTPGGVMYDQRWNNDLQFVTSASFLLTVAGREAMRCLASAAQSFEILDKSQVKYMAGYFTWYGKQAGVNEAMVGDPAGTGPPGGEGTGPAGDDGIVVQGDGKKAATDDFLVLTRDRGLVAQLKVAMAVGADYWLQAFVDWVLASLRSPRYRPVWAWPWLKIIGSPIMQAYYDDNKMDGSCVLYACLVCIEAQHRLAFERCYGAGTFPYNVTRPEDFRMLCRTWGAWKTGGGTVESRVLDLVQSVGGVATDRLPGWKPCYLQVKRYEYYTNLPEVLTPLMLSWILRTKGPIIGSLYAGNNYYQTGWETSAYRGRGGGKKGESNHVVVCTGFSFELQPNTIEVEMHIDVVDNHREDGPVRRILSSVFTSFCLIEVEPLDATTLRGNMSGSLSNV